MRPIGKPMDWPPYPTIMREPHFYADSVEWCTAEVVEWNVTANEA